MAFEDSVAAGLSGSNAPAPPTPAPSASASAPQPPVDTTTVPASSTLTPPAPAAQPAQRPAMQPASAPQEDSTPGSFFHRLSHSFAGSVLGALAGPRTVIDRYETSDDGKMRAVTRPMHAGERLQLLAQAALEGLSAGASVGPQKSKAAGIAAGFGAGFEANRAHAQQQDLLKRQQSQQEFEEQQKATLHKATVAMTNAQTHNFWNKIQDDENAKDIERQKNLGIVNDLQDYTNQNPQSKLTVQMVTAEQAMAMREADAHTVAKHTFLPIGVDQAKDENGNPIFEKDGVTPKLVRKFAAIGGSADSKVGLPQGIVDDLQRYSKFDPRLKSPALLPAGQEVPLSSLLSTFKIITEDKGKEADGWKNATAVTVDGKPKQHNPYTQETREFAGGVPLPVQKEQADIQEKQAGAFEKTQQGKKAQSEAGSQGQQKMWDQGKNPFTGEALNLGNAPDTMMVDRNGQPIPFKMLATMKPTQQESNRADFAKSTLHILDIIDSLRQRGKLPNGPISGVTAKNLAKFGLGSDSQEALDLIGFAQSASTGAHVGGRFNQEIMHKMDTMLNVNMNDEQFLAAEQGIRDVMKPYSDQGGRLTVGEYKADLLGRVPQGSVAVQIPGQQPGFVPQGRIKEFKADHPNAVIVQ